MKNTKKIVSLILAVCMIASLAISASAANTVDASGGTGTSSVTLSSTADGSIGGDPAATKMSVVVPTVLRTNAYRRNSPSSQWEAVEEVSLSPWGIVAPCLPQQGQQVTVSRSGYAVLAPSCSPLRPTGDCTCNAVYAIVKLREKTKLSSHYL